MNGDTSQATPLRQAVEIPAADRFEAAQLRDVVGKEQLADSSPGFARNGRDENSQRRAFRPRHAYLVARDGLSVGLLHEQSQLVRDRQSDSGATEIDSQRGVHGITANLPATCRRVS